MLLTKIPGNDDDDFDDRNTVSAVSGVLKIIDTVTGPDAGSRARCYLLVLIEHYRAIEQGARAKKRDAIMRFTYSAASAMIEREVRFAQCSFPEA